MVSSVREEEGQRKESGEARQEEGSGSEVRREGAVTVPPLRRIAIVGTGVSGLISAFLLQRSGCFEVTLFEKESHPGGHALTLRAHKVMESGDAEGNAKKEKKEEGEGRGGRGGDGDSDDEEDRGGMVTEIGESEEGEFVDLGFQVFNLSTYPHLSAFFDLIGVASEASDMSFSLSIRHPSRSKEEEEKEAGGIGTDAATPLLEWSSRYGLSSIFAQPSNALSPSFLSMLTEVGTHVV